MSVEIIIAFVVGLIVGLLVAWYYWRQRMAEHEAQLSSLQLSSRNMEQNLRAKLQEHETKVNRLTQQVTQKDSALQELNAQLDWRKLTIQQLGEEMTERDNRLTRSEATIEDLTAQLKKRHEAVHELQQTASEAPAPVAQDVELPSRMLDAVPAAPAKPDNLKRIEGIGPKIAQLLNDAGIMTFAQLAAADVTRLEQVLEKAGPNFQLANPSTWPEQAKLATAEDWQALEVLQDQLKGGRRERLQPL